MQSQNEIRQSITNSIIDALRNGGLPPWRKPWNDDLAGFGLATSLSSGKSYRGINQLILQSAAATNGWQSRSFSTFNQIRAAGGCVKKGEKAQKVILWKPIARKRTNDDGKEVDDSYLVMREFCVFNVEQTSGLDRFQVGFAKRHDNACERYENADAVIEAIGADIRYGGNEAYYRISEDYIRLPHRHQFESSEAFYETTFHELVHFSEHPSRLNWNRAEQGYEMGELVAEIGACQMMAELGLPTTTNLQNHAAYLNSWLKGMSVNSTFIFMAAAQASKAVDYLLSFSRTTAPEPVEAEELVLV